MSRSRHVPVVKQNTSTLAAIRASACTKTHWAGSRVCLTCRTCTNPRIPANDGLQRTEVALLEANRIVNSSIWTNWYKLYIILEPELRAFWDNFPKPPFRVPPEVAIICPDCQIRSSDFCAHKMALLSPSHKDSAAALAAWLQNTWTHMNTRMSVFPTHG